MPQDVIESIDEEIRNLFSPIYLLKRRRNTLVPISRLPPEILGVIFLCNVIDGESNFRYPPPEPWLGGWMRLLSVCQHWREVALNTPQLWSFWSLTSPRLMGIFASRSKAAPLYIRMTRSSSQYRTLWATIFQNPDTRDRIRELHLLDNGSSLKSFLYPFNRSCSPNYISHIHSLRIQKVGMQLVEEMLELSTGFTDQQFPHLRELEFRGCEFNWDSQIFYSSMLTHLTIANTPTSNNAPTMSRLFSILSIHPLLEQLSLYEGAMPLSVEVVKCPTRVDLNHLKHIQLEGGVESCLALMEHISYPRTLTIVSLYLKPCSIANFESHILPFLSRYYERGETDLDDAPSVDQFRVSGNRRSVRMSFWYLVESTNCSSLRSCNFTMKLDGFQHSIRLRAMVALCATLRLGHLRRLYVRGIEMKLGEWCSDVFGILCGLEKLELGGDDVLEAIYALNPNIGLDSNGECEEDDYNRERPLTVIRGNNFPVDNLTIASSPKNEAGSTYTHTPEKTMGNVSDVRLPNLKHLVIEGANLYNDESDISILADALIPCLEARQDANCGLDSVTLEFCTNVCQGDVEVCESFVDVEWDGYGASGLNDYESEGEVCETCGQHLNV